jgi:hypothetical protein
MGAATPFGATESGSKKLIHFSAASTGVRTEKV